MTQPPAPAGWYAHPSAEKGKIAYWNGAAWEDRRPPAPCAVGPCTQNREEGREYCATHGPSSQWTAPPAAPIATSYLTEPGGQSAIICPHCQTRGRVHTKQIKVKRGVSGGKATAAVFTAGFSMLATGLSRKETVTQATCGQCRSTWMF